MPNNKKAAKAQHVNDQPAIQASGSEPKPSESNRKPRKTKKDEAWAPQDSLPVELAALELRIKHVQGDGNCFFRSVADQLQGNSGDYKQLRQRAVDYMEEQEADFAPFIEDDGQFAKHCKFMRQDGTWAGQHELVAVARMLPADLRIYQAGQPSWTISSGVTSGKDAPPIPTLHMSYHDGEHYNSIRCAEDYGSGPPVPIRANTRRALVPQAPAGGWSKKEEGRVMEGTGCYDAAQVQRALQHCRGDVDEAIELIVEQVAADAAPEPAAALKAYPVEGVGQEPPAASAAEDDFSAADAVAIWTASLGIEESPDGADGPSAAGTEGAADPSGASTEGVPRAAEPSASQTAAKDGDKSEKERPLGRNRKCPCGSKLKYKNCCGCTRATAARQSEAAAAAAAEHGPTAGTQTTTLYI